MIMFNIKLANRPRKMSLITTIAQKRTIWMKDMKPLITKIPMMKNRLMKKTNSTWFIVLWLIELTKVRNTSARVSELVSHQVVRLFTSSRHLEPVEQLPRAMVFQHFWRISGDIASDIDNAVDGWRSHFPKLIVFRTWGVTTITVPVPLSLSDPS